MPAYKMTHNYRPSLGAYLKSTHLKMNTNENTPVTIPAILSTPLTVHPYSTGINKVYSTSYGEPYEYQNNELGLDGVLVVRIYGDSMGRNSPGFPRLTIEEASAVTAELMRRWNAHAEIVSALSSACDKITFDIDAEAQCRFGMNYEQAQNLINANPLIIQIRQALASARA